MTEKDRFGFKKLTVEQEVAVSFTLLVLGLFLILSTMLPLVKVADLSPGFLGMIMVATAYFFAVESIRELEQKDHFLSTRLEKKAEEVEEAESEGSED